jgi:DNA polymerase
MDESLVPSSENSAVLFIGQNPGREEDDGGQPFIGASGKRLREAYVKGSGINELASVYLTNAVRCHTYQNAPPALRHCKACAPYLGEDILRASENQHLLVCCLGKHAVTTFHKYFLGTSGGLSLQDSFRMNGEQVYHPDVGHLTVFATYHPAYVMRNPKTIHTVHSHMQLIIDCLEGTMAVPSKPNIVPVRLPHARRTTKGK